ncbi:MAG: hypothetical protein ACFNYI_05335, partial [Eubacterium sp.]
QQEGHIRAAAESSGMVIPDRMISFHFSGGTTEAVLLDRTKRKRQEAGWYQKVGGTEDLAAGQVLDRIGVQLHFPFPCGQYLDQAALEMDGCRIPDHELFRLSSIRCKDGFVHFSGLETDCSRRLDRILNMDDQELGKILAEEGNNSPESHKTGNSLPESFLSGESDVKREAAGLMVLLLMKRITRAAALMTADLAKQYDVHSFLLAGGVASSQFMRTHFQEELDRAQEKLWKKQPGKQNEICFGTPVMSSDNAVGVAFLGLDALQKKKRMR